MAATPSRRRSICPAATSRDPRLGGALRRRRRCWYAAWLDGRAEAAKKAAAGPATAAAPKAPRGADIITTAARPRGPAAGSLLPRRRQRRAGERSARRHAACASAARPRSSGRARRPRAGRGARHGPGLAPHLPQLGARHRDERARCGHRPAGPDSRVSDGRWQLQACPDDGPGLARERQRHHPRRVADARERHGGGRGPEKAIYHARTTDGRTFTPRRRLDGRAAARRIPSSRRSRRERPWRCGTRSADGRSPRRRAADPRTGGAAASSARAPIRRSRRSTTASWSPGRRGPATPRSSASGAFRPDAFDSGWCPATWSRIAPSRTMES